MENIKFGAYCLGKQNSTIFPYKKRSLFTHISFVTW